MNQRKYLNSPETPIYKKSYVLYNLHRAKDAIRKEERAILVEGYMDAIGVSAAGIGAVVASCGTALTTRRFRRSSGARRIVVNFDPDAAGAKAAEKSIGLLLEEGMQVRIMELDGGLDPDEYCKERGADAYRERLEQAKGYFYWLADARAEEVRYSHVGGEDFGASVSVARGAANLGPVGTDGGRQRRRRLYRRGSGYGARHLPPLGGGRGRKPDRAAEDRGPRR